MTLAPAPFAELCASSASEAGPPAAGAGLHNVSFTWQYGSQGRQLRTTAHEDRHKHCCARQPQVPRLARGEHAALAVAG